jgi:tRNA threonylcarbamoyladenosine biosynthesis protein TsaE
MEYMSTEMTWTTETSEPEATELLAEKLGASLRGGEVIELISDLGGGKTTFTRGLVRGTGSTDKVASPTFTLSREYRAPQFTISHFDFYRLNEAGIVGDELKEVIVDPQHVVVVEWGDIVVDILPDERIRITIAQTPEGNRTLEFKYPMILMDRIQALQT